MSDQTRLSLGLRLRALGRRYGLRTRGVVAAVLAILIVGAGAIGAQGLVGSGGLTIERGADGDQGTQKHQSEAVDRGEQAASDEATADGATARDAGPARRVVHVDGAVSQPGVYVLEEENPRVNDAVTHAGGLTPEADTSTVNLAAPVEDGQKVHIPAVGEVVQEQPIAASDPASGGGGDTSGLVNINTANESELCSLPGIGEVTAAAIVEEREANGAYASPEDLMRVSGIGEKKYAKLEGLICV